MQEYHSSSLLSLKPVERSYNMQVRTPFNHCIPSQGGEPSAYAMNPNVSKQNAGNSNSGYVEGSQTNPIHPYLKRNTFEDPTSSYSSRDIISQFLEKSSKKKNSADHQPILSVKNLSHSSADSFQEESNCNFSRDGEQDPGSSFSQHHSTNPGEGDRLFNEHLQAKRARVENIIRGMNSSPSDGLHHNELEREGGQRQGSLNLCKENKRKQRLPQQQQQQQQQGEDPRKSPGLVLSLKRLRREECHRLKQQLQEMQGRLHELQEKFLQVYDTSESEQEDQEDTSDSCFHLASTEYRENTMEKYHSNLPDMNQSPCVDHIQTISHVKETGKEASKHRDLDKKFNHCNNYGFSLVESGYLAESLKYELTNAVAHIVDSAVQLFSVTPSSTSSQSFQSLPASRTKSTPQNGNTNMRMPSHDFQCPPDPVTMHQYFDNCQNPCTIQVHDQTEAIPLVVRKSPQNQSNLVGPIIKQDCQMPHNKPPLTLVLDSQMSLTELPDPTWRYNMQNCMGHTFAVTAKDNVTSKPACLSWDTVKLRSKVTSHHTAHQLYPGFRQKPPENLNLPHIKSECGELRSVVDVTPYSSANEGLTPNHLKKAKLMFFYTRYPNSTTLKTYFSDVKFNRCITSQLIKWFSNFREFYYIQMEKFARQAVNDGLTDASDLKVTRDSDLYRALNGHYNKANDFQIPQEFLEVAEVTLREFFNAVKLGKDSDPSWKKSIYKVISKLDSEVPEMFNSQGCLQDILYD